eukprot:TRINITY_DN19337_c1_g1_i1.p1 TRINITY_DN19337_c1_g1~~TRINITY_DN19337_c1_g1_i1.p1  ORF type:complete len:454 (-),score=95.80 TRINITY_DN19337_c1_g1_i1:278-1639(-)
MAAERSLISRISSRQVLLALAGLLSPLLLQGCGESGSSDTPAPTPSPSGTPAPTASPTPAPSDTPSPSVDYDCQSDLAIGASKMQNMSAKGMALDDTTLFGCPDKIPALWPNTNEAIQSLRLFKSYRPGQSEEEIADMHKKLVAHVTKHNIKVLVGSQITCSDKDDEEDWHYAKLLMKALGKDHILGLAVGNELDQLYHHSDINTSCIERIWEGHLYSETVKRIMEAREMLDYQELPVTSVFTGEIIWTGADIKLLQPRKYLKKVFGQEKGVAAVPHFVVTLNFYPIFDPTNKLDPDGEHCTSAVKMSACFDSPSCLTIKNVVQARNYLKQVTGAQNRRLWVGELGWSSPKPDTFNNPIAKCKEFFSYQMLYDYYSNFLSWQLLDSSKIEGPEVAFYFTVRDSNNFGNQEHFGLISDCVSKKCKLNQSQVTPESWVSRDALDADVSSIVNVVI